MSKVPLLINHSYSCKMYVGLKVHGTCKMMMTSSIETINVYAVCTLPKIGETIGCITKY